MYTEDRSPYNCLRVLEDDRVVDEGERWVGKFDRTGRLNGFYTWCRFCRLISTMGSRHRLRLSVSRGNCKHRFMRWDLSLTSRKVQDFWDEEALKLERSYHKRCQLTAGNVTRLSIFMTLNSPGPPPGMGLPLMSSPHTEKKISIRSMCATWIGVTTLYVSWILSIRLTLQAWWDDPHNRLVVFLVHPKLTLAHHHRLLLYPSRSLLSPYPV